MSDGRSGGPAPHGKARIPLGPGGEFDLIRKLLGPEKALPGGIDVGPGDDCAVLEGGLVISTDLTVEGIHFRAGWITLEEVGYRATAAALSDLAAMAAEPVGALISMALGSGAETGGSSAMALELQEGAAAACRREEVEILGGDLTRSPGPLVLNVVALGRTHAPVLRTGARVGDEVWVTGWLGASRGAVLQWERGDSVDEALREAFARPKPRIKEARWLAERVPIHGLIDLSDGLAGDAGHLAAASGLAVVLGEGTVPAHPALAGILGEGENPLQFALQGGEDYELCLTAPSETLDEWVGPFQDSFAIPLTKVGRVVEGKGVLLEDGNGTLRSVEGEGFSHFPEATKQLPHEEDG